MTNLFLHQKEQGGIIDLDADEINVISIQTEDANERVSSRKFLFPVIVSTKNSTIFILNPFVVAIEKVKCQESSAKATINRYSSESSSSGSRIEASQRRYG